MTMNFKKSLATGIALIALTTACTIISTKESPSKCAGKNSCKAGTNNCAAPKEANTQTIKN